jgi:multisubunit Na+/H+ antiporter MnhB subunit
VLASPTRHRACCRAATGRRCAAARRNPRGRATRSSLAARALLPLALLVSAYIFLRGHNLPGGGFIAGLITCGRADHAVLADGIGVDARTDGRQPPADRPGLLIAGLTGWPAGCSAPPSSPAPSVTRCCPCSGKFRLASAMAFDLGVYLTVVGASLMILTRIGSFRESSRQLREGAPDGIPARHRHRRAHCLRRISAAARPHLSGGARPHLLLGYAVNLFMFSMGRVSPGAAGHQRRPRPATPTRCRRRWC